MPPSPKKQTAVGKAAKGKVSRRAKEQQRAIDGLTRPAIKRLAKKGGVKRMKADVFLDTRDACSQFVSTVLDNAVVLAEFENKSSITSNHLIRALQMNNVGVIGFGAITPKSIGISIS